MLDNNSNLTIKEAEEIIRGTVKFGYVTPSLHCKSRMKLRGYDILDVELVLSKGQIKEQPVFDQQYENWVCNVEGASIEGDIAIVVTAILSETELVCLTIKPK